MSLLSTSNPPDLFDRVQIRRIWWQRNDGNGFTDVGVFLLTLDQSFSLFMPWCIIHNQDDLLTALKVGSGQEFPDAGNCGFIVEPGRLRNEEFSAPIGDKTTVCDRFSARVRLHLWAAAFGEPLSGNGCFHRKVYLVLKDHSRFLPCEELFQFFLKVSRLGSSSWSFDGKAWGRIWEKPS